MCGRFSATFSFWRSTSGSTKLIGRRVLVSIPLHSLAHATLILGGFILSIPEFLPAASAPPIIRRSGIPSSFNYTVRGGPTSSTANLWVPLELRAPFTIEVRNGTEPRVTPVSHVKMWLNGAQIVDTSDFDNGVTTVKRNIALQQENNIFRVDVDGLDRASLWVSFTGTPNQEDARVLTETLWSRPDKETQGIRNFAANPYIDPPYEMIIKPPAIDNEMVKVPVIILLNGTEVFGPSDFQQNTIYVKRVVELLQQNKLEIRNIKWPGGSALSVIIIGKRGPKYPGPLRPQAFGQ